MEQSNDEFYKQNEDDLIWWLDSESKGEWLFSFDKITIFNLFSDYPDKLTPEQKKNFDEENPFWKDYFSDRQ